MGIKTCKLVTFEMHGLKWIYLIFYNFFYFFGTRARVLFFYFSLLIFHFFTQLHDTGFYKSTILFFLFPLSRSTFSFCHETVKTASNYKKREKFTTPVKRLRQSLVLRSQDSNPIPPGSQKLKNDPLIQWTRPLDHCGRPNGFISFIIGRSLPSSSLDKESILQSLHPTAN